MDTPTTPLPNQSDIPRILMSIQKRIVLLERDIQHIEEMLARADHAKTHRYAIMQNTMAHTKEELKEIKAIQEKNTQSMIVLADEISGSAKQDHTQQIREAIEGIEFGEFITTREMEQIVNGANNKQ